MTVTISRLYDDYSSASRVVTELEAAGIPHSDISIIASNSDNWYANDRTGSRATTTRPAAGQSTAKVDRDRDGVDDRAEGAATGGGIGAAVGGAAGLLTGLGLMAIPGVGPVVAAGWLVATLAGAAAGGLTGGLIGALTRAGVSEQDANVVCRGCSPRRHVGHCSCARCRSRPMRDDPESRVHQHPGSRSSLPA